jgi:hypothetical protein
MPVHAPHLITHLYMTDTHGLIQSRPLQINNIEMQQRLSESDSTQMRFMYDSLSSAFTAVSASEKEGIMNLYRKYLKARRNQMLPERKKEIQGDPFCSALTALKGSLGEMAGITLRFIQEDLVIRLSDRQ